MDVFGEREAAPAAGPATNGAVAPLVGRQGGAVYAARPVVVNFDPGSPHASQLDLTALHAAAQQRKMAAGHVPVAIQPEQALANVARLAGEALYRPVGRGHQATGAGNGTVAPSGGGGLQSAAVARPAYQEYAARPVAEPEVRVSFDLNGYPIESFYHRVLVGARFVLLVLEQGHRSQRFMPDRGNPMAMLVHGHDVVWQVVPAGEVYEDNGCEYCLLELQGQQALTPPAALERPASQGLRVSGRPVALAGMDPEPVDQQLPAPGYNPFAGAPFAPAPPLSAPGRPVSVQLPPEAYPPAGVLPPDGDLGLPPGTPGYDFLRGEAGEPPLGERYRPFSGSRTPPGMSPEAALSILQGGGIPSPSSQRDTVVVNDLRSYERRAS